MDSIAVGRERFTTEVRDEADRKSWTLIAVCTGEGRAQAELGAAA